MPLVGSYVEGFFYGAFAVRHPVFYLIMMALQFGVITVACSGIGLLLSVYQANLFVAVGTCGLVFMWQSLIFRVEVYLVYSD